jgi:5-methylcytosine-specific restriction endonuclease McrA
MQAQRLYWQENPEAKRQHYKDWDRGSWWLQYQINPDLRLYHREKSKRRKAQARGQTPLQVPVAAIRQRFSEFNNCCAYCGQEGDMQIEHVEPMSEGGLHDIGNIVPACGPCNYNKRTSEMESWYRQQPFFSELRLARIRRVVRRPEGAQLALALA